MRTPQRDGDNCPGPGVDLHVHSVYSDGRHTPQQLCQLADDAGLAHLALCDHDTLAGIEPMAGAVESLNLRRSQEGKAPLAFLPGLELSTGDRGTLHVLAYGADPKDACLQDFLQEAEARRQSRFQEMLAKLGALGVEIPSEELPTLSGPLGRAHIARALQRMGVVKTIQQAFGRYLGEGRAAYVPYAHISATEAVALLKRVRLAPVLAHPCRMGLETTAMLSLIEALQDKGLVGIEVYHPSATPKQTGMLEAFARRQGLLVTGGSDFHGDEGRREALGRWPGQWENREQDVRALYAYIQKVRT